MENPELFYKKPESVPDFSITKVTDIHGVEIFDVSFPSPVQTKHAENNTAYGLYDKAVPVRYTTELWEALGRPKIRWYPCAHASMVFFAKSVIKDIIQFIRGIN